MPYIQRRLLYTTLLSVAASSSAVSQDSDSLDCTKELPVDGTSYDLTSLAGERAVNRTREMPPSTMVDELRFDICKDLSTKDGVEEGDQCSTGTRACLTKTNEKPGQEKRIIAVIPVAKRPLRPTYTTIQSSAGLSIQLYGPSYPPNSSPTVPQSLNLTLLCKQDATSDPTFIGYENGIVSVEWNTSAGCPANKSDGGNGRNGDGNEGNGNDSGDGGNDGNKGHSTGGTGIGWFFLLLLISFLGYFALGMYYNYNNFGATGWDLVPHRDFWRDVPYLFRDFTEHLCSTLRPGRQGGSRRGYMAV